MCRNNFPMTNSRYSTSKLRLPLSAAAALLLLAGGCATQPRSGMATYFISGSAYVPLDGVCSEKGIRHDYDELTRIVTLAKNSSSMKFQVGTGGMVSNGRLAQFSSSADYYKGMIVVPQDLRQKIEELFSDTMMLSRAFQRLRKVVIDPGHGGKDPGARAPGGVEEKDMVLDIARKLRDGLQQEGVNVVMTRSTDVFIPLEKRAAIANKNGADLFISIHANASRSHSLKGFEVYYVSPKIDFAGKRAVASARSDPLNVENTCLLNPSLNLKAILWDMIYAFDRREAIELSRLLCQTMRSNLDTRVIGVKNANFCVLREAAMPAVLIEVGFLTNPSEEKLIKSEFYRQKLADGIKEGMRSYCEGLGAADDRFSQQTTALVKEGR
jgi:N-acetylmuramoyl-L-alanine amidase